jgi:hypothetical protein
MTPGEAFAAIVVVFGIDTFEEHELDSDLASQVPALIERGFLQRDGRSISVDLDRLSDVVTSGAIFEIDRRVPERMKSCPECAGHCYLRSMTNEPCPTCKATGRVPEESQ